MSERRRAPDRVIVELKGIHLNNDGGTFAVEDGRMMVFLCPSCNDVHVVFQFDGIEGQFNMGVPPAQAEKLARLLVAPEIIE